VNGDINFSGNVYQGGELFISSGSSGPNPWIITDNDISYTSGNVSVTGDLIAQTLTLGSLSVTPGYNLATVTNFGSTTSDTIYLTNPTTGLVVDSNLEVGTANLFVDTTTSNVGIGTVTPGYTLDISGDINFSGDIYKDGIIVPSVNPWVMSGNDISYATGNVTIGNDLTVTGNAAIGDELTVTGNAQLQGGVALGGHIIPTINAAFDIGSPEFKIRDIYVDDNSFWIGDTAKISSSGGKMKFKRRKLNKIPKVVRELAIAHSVREVHNEETAEDDAVTYLKAHFPSDNIDSLVDLKLRHWKAYTKSIDATKEISDIFVDHDEDYEAVTAAEAWSEVGSNIFSTHKVTIGATTEPRAELDVVGTGAIIVPSGTAEQQPTGVNGMIRYNSTIGYMEVYTATGWSVIAQPPR